MTDPTLAPKPIRLKGRSFLALVLSPEQPFDRWLDGLDDLARRSTGFFLGRPIVLDVENIEVGKAELKTLVDELSSRGVRIMGIEGALPSQLAPGMPPAMRGGRPAGDIAAPEAGEAAPAAAPAEGGAPASDEPVVAALPAALAQPRTVPSLILEEPVRSGQTIIFPEGDVTVLGSVSSGAEIVAGGSIHVYGALRGRALAGSVGNADARIFCRKLEAELVAIDGLYKMVDDMDARLRGQAVQVWLEGDAIKAQALG
ncbi:septum site-determining protein MinC [Antarcticirhabdus aurantiaca]|uniref:Septum site-determining protein MinC n=1 Tax=Antarcticirhabdus aurantiaca TaxID=2606717 RepID=A0ACD4NKF4_9HYPH|nr:septum site-determining protein MinC [Antarcticirhabdus aurantiaca]WAJ27292.1 septum site-determining protein MinC [Jeongeuplla avenae]